MADADLPNSNCITATEPVETSFRVSEKEGEVRLKSASIAKNLRAGCLCAIALNTPVFGRDAGPAADPLALLRQIKTGKER